MLERTNRIGRHLRTSGGLNKTIEVATELGCETVQIFVSNPQGWAVPAPRPDAEDFIEGSRKLGLYPVVAHAKYLINLASPEAGLRGRSVEALARELVTASSVGVDVVVVHAGSHGGDGEQKGMDRLVDGLGGAREQARKLVGSAGVVSEPVVENSVGAGTQLCSTLESLGEVAQRAGVGLCLDTAHAFVAGYDLSTPPSARLFAGKVGAIVGSEIALVHLNDARNELGSHRDGHRKIGQGQVPIASWPEFFAGLPGVPVVMETPYDGLDADADELRRVKELAGGLLTRPEAV